MNVCYCSNYYSSIRCTNPVGKFGQRCKLCTVLKSGASLTPGLLPDDCLWLTATSSSDEERDDSSDNGSITSRRPSWIFSRFSFPSSPTSKAAQDAGIE
ncbi:hypothetical protein C8A05DRAFT_29537 [Staphylotrichum tortipilum]|uniref:Uncharacterized protein n=1 Tax=Staphylotrichum tortipilum TaxID=2831512 RepID=A0AAN6MUM8_9PEZI|nr:hypothetical protein C8A05DRAFT_29537 [Staphylotrichum longicolle]